MGSIVNCLDSDLDNIDNGFEYMVFFSGLKLRVVALTIGIVAVTIRAWP